MDKHILETAAAAIHITPDEAAKHCKEVPQINGWLFWDSARGGLSILIDEKGEKLAATSAVSFDMHLKAFCAGNRN